MASKLIPSGRSQVVKIPTALIRKAGINGNIELQVRGDELIIRAKGKRRTSKAALIRKMEKAALPWKRLLQLAKKFPPPQAWYDGGDSARRRKKKKANPRAGWDQAFDDAIRKHGPIPELSAEDRSLLEMPNEFDETL